MRSTKAHRIDGQKVPAQPTGQKQQRLRFDLSISLLGDALVERLFLSEAEGFFDEVEVGGTEFSSRPDFMVLIYPVISMSADVTHGGSRKNLLGEDPSAELAEYYSNDLQVTAQTPPTFLVHALDDKAVPFENSLQMYRALQRAGVPAEFAIYERGGHGFGLVFKAERAALWPLRCERWLRQQGFLTSK